MRHSDGLCARCRVEPKRSNGAYCIECWRHYCREWSKKNPEKRRASTRAWRQQHKTALARINYDAKHRRRHQCRQKLGSICVCCGEWRDSFLDIDHIHNDGAAQRRAYGPHQTYAEVLSMENPREKYQLLCSNCNQSKRRLGRCEHESERLLASSNHCRGMFEPTC